MYVKLKVSVNVCPNLFFNYVCRVKLKFDLSIVLQNSIVVLLLNYLLFWKYH